MRKDYYSAIRLSAILILLAAFATACNGPSKKSAREGATDFAEVTALFETDAVPQDKDDDAADDPAIWVNRNEPEKSVLFGTDKLGGLASYNLKGRQLHYYSTGKMNNCDIRYDFPLNGDPVDILAASNRSTHSISLYKIGKNGTLDSLHTRVITSEMEDEVYGICMYESTATGKFYVFLNSKAGEVEQWELYEKEGGVDARLVRSFDVGTQTEGMVADDEQDVLYLGHEVAGIWKFDAGPESKNEGELLENSTDENPAIQYDIEGLAIYNSGNGGGYLIASSQGNNSFALFERQGNNKYLGSFRISDGKTDGVQDTDGIDVTGIPLNSDFPHGLLVVQDGYNFEGSTKKSQNFKLVSWKEIENELFTNNPN